MAHTLILTDPEIATEEHLDNNFLWHLLMLSQVGIPPYTLDVGGCISGCVGGEMDLWMKGNESMNGCVDGWMDGQKDGYVYVAQKGICLLSACTSAIHHLYFLEC